jgi:hypothetical protein
VLLQGARYTSPLSKFLFIDIKKPISLLSNSKMPIKKELDKNLLYQPGNTQDTTV